MEFRPLAYFHHLFVQAKRKSARMPAKRAIKRCKACREEAFDVGCTYNVCLACCSAPPGRGDDLCALFAHREARTKAEEVVAVDNADGGAKGVAQARADESVDQVVLSAVMAQVAQLSREVEGLREARVEKRTRVETVEKKEEVSVLDVVFRPTMWTRAVLDGAESPAEAVARVDTLVMAIDRHYRIGDLRANGLPANASARALEAVRAVLLKIARHPEDEEGLRGVLQPLGTTLYSNFLLLTHGSETAGRWQAAVSDRAVVDDEFVAAMQALPPVLRRPREEKPQDTRGRGSWGGRGMQWQRGRAWSGQGRGRGGFERQGGRGMSEGISSRAGEGGGRSGRAAGGVGGAEGVKEGPPRRG